MPTFVREIAMEPGDEQRLAVRPAHREYVHAMFAQGSIRMSGPLVGDAGAILVYSAPHEAAALELIAADPYTQAEVVQEVSLREWTVVVPDS